MYRQESLRQAPQNPAGCPAVTLGDVVSVSLRNASYSGVIRGISQAQSIQKQVMAAYFITHDQGPLSPSMDG